MWKLSVNHLPYDKHVLKYNSRSTGYSIMLILQIMDSINVSQDKGWYIYCVIEKLLAESTTEKCSISQFLSPSWRCLIHLENVDSTKFNLQ